ncbi:hypothetical protein RAS1_39040 [Phycisphaerae bacterium RAS1]|nr:hypothetical protein RAS1_39040 [Phycisphaerae bacterium RAS1]
MRGWTLLVAAAALAHLGVSRAAGQVLSDGSASFLTQQRIADDEKNRERQRIAPVESLLDWQWGGWLDYYLFHFSDGEQGQRVLQRPSGALWTRLSIDNGAHEFFARVRMRYDYYDFGDEGPREESYLGYEFGKRTGRRRDWVGPNFDRAWYQIDVGRAFRWTDPSDPAQLKLRIGRQNVQFGTGYVLDMPMDAVLLDGTLYDFNIVGLFGRSIASFPNIDRSRPVDSHSNRRFYGVQVAYDAIQHHRPFVYALWNDDKIDERPADPYQSYSYDSFYFGGGARGELAHNLNYWFEATYESGHNYGDGMIFRQDYIDAWGLNAGLEYLWDLPTRPRAAFEYMFASGDGDRLSSPTNALGGNRNGREDNSFVGFGFRDTGISLAPTLSNLHVWKASGSLAPFEKVELLRDMELGANFFLYNKHHARAAISDPLADQMEGFVGWEMDYFVNWRLASDLSWTLRWGSFFPGDAYEDKDYRHFLFTGLTWSF